MKRVFRVQFKEGRLEASAFTVIAKNIPDAIAKAKRILTQRYKEDHECWEDPWKVWASSVTLETEIDD